MNHNDIDKEILRLLNQLDRPASTEEIARRINRAWHSVQKYCHILKSEGKINGFRVGIMNLWVIEKGMGEE